MKKLCFIILLLPSVTLAAFPTGWGRKCEIVIQSSKIDANLTNYPVAMTPLTLPSEMFDDGKVKTDGGDIRFSSDEDGSTQIAAEVVLYDTTGTNEAEIWVIVPSVSSSSNTSIWVWYDSAGSSLLAEGHAYGRENVWDSEFRLVYHLEETPTGVVEALTFNDATSNNNDGNEGSALLATDTILGVMGGALDFRGVANAHIHGNDGDPMDIDSFLTAEFWTKLDSRTQPGGNNRGRPLSYYTSYEMVLFDTNRTQSQWGFSRIIWDGSTQYLHYENILADTGVWYHQVMVYDGDSLYGFRNAVADSTATPHVGDIDQDGFLMIFGDFQSNAYEYDGILDEIRITRGVRSNSWINATYENISDPNAFAVEGTPETPGAPAEPDTRRRLQIIRSD